MKKHYWEYFKYIMEHKKNVFKVAWKEKMYMHAFTHDLSKFHPKEFFAYADWFYGALGVRIKGKSDKDIINMGGRRYKAIIEKLGLNGGFDYIKEEHNELKLDFDKAWQHHKDKNPHHWNHWHECQADMPNKYVSQMLIDWKAMGLKFGDTAQEFYLKNFDKIKLTSGVRLSLEHKLGLTFHRCCECDEVYWMNCKEIIEDTIKYKSEHFDTYCDKLTLEWINRINNKYSVNMLKLLGYKLENIVKEK